MQSELRGQHHPRPEDEIPGRDLLELARRQRLL
jgi:hypothetical protein